MRMQMEAYILESRRKTDGTRRGRCALGVGPAVVVPLNNNITHVFQQQQQKSIC